MCAAGTPLRARDAELLQEGVSCAIATLDAITASGFFDVMPAEPEDREEFNKGSWLLTMLRDHLGSIQRRVDAEPEAAA